MRYGLKMRTENCNIKKNINYREYIDTTAKDTDMLYYPDWKPVQKNKWLSEDFKLTNATYTGERMYKDAWKVHPIYIGKADDYEDGLEAVGQKGIDRTENPKLEGDKPKFIGTIRKDLWQDTLKTSQSIRCFK